MPPRFRLMAGKFRLSLTLPVPLVVALCVAPQDEILAAWRLTGWVTLTDSILYEDGSVGGCYRRNFSSTRRVSVTNSTKTKTCRSDRYSASTRKVSPVTPTNGSILVEYTIQPCDPASEAPCRQELVPFRGESSSTLGCLQRHASRARVAMTNQVLTHPLRPFILTQHALDSVHVIGGVWGARCGPCRHCVDETIL